MSRPNPITTSRQELHAEKVRRNREVALDAFIAKKAEIDALLARLASLSDDHVNAHPEEINRGNVGTLDHYAVRRSGYATGTSSLACARPLFTLKRITDSAFGEGENAG